MKKSYDLYGFTKSSLDDARLDVERALVITLNAHESDYLGGDYFRVNADATEEFVLQKNYISADDAWMELPFSDAPFLLYVNATQRSDTIKNVLEQVEGVKLLRHQEV